MRTNRRSLLVALVALVALGACSGGPDDHQTQPPPPPPATTSPTPSPHAPHASGQCVSGWTVPPAGSALRATPLRVIERATRRKGPFVVKAIRYFLGPESPPSDQGYLATVQRWYVKAVDRSDPSFRARFLVEKREFGSGLAAVAPFGTRGFASPDWVGFQLDTTDPAPSPYRGLPGKWSGTPYDFATGGDGLTFPGLPSQVAGCLRGT
jgi:hypothetical protein